MFILFVNEGMFPSKKSIEESGDAEERRLFYFALTRAEDELFLWNTENGLALGFKY